MSPEALLTRQHFMRLPPTSQNISLTAMFPGYSLNCIFLLILNFSSLLCDIPAQTLLRLLWLLSSQLHCSIFMTAMMCYAGCLAPCWRIAPVGFWDTKEGLFGASCYSHHFWCMALSLPHITAHSWSDRILKQIPDPFLPTQIWLKETLGFMPGAGDGGRVFFTMVSVLQLSLPSASRLTF